ncbi:MAG: alanine--tRNA ligase [Patescibacteria group bacterium]|nr:alanine--tRNA ligase [Patescibacteria group bacterium]
MTVNEIRQKFINYFESKDHKLMPSSSLIPKDDPSVLITTAGMQQFKRWFSNEIKPAYKRTVTIQKCVRTNDIEEIGDETHLSFFEMLGNFSFGDYFKKEAIEWGLDFVEKELKVDRSRIWVSIFAGDDKTPRDNESEEIWKSLGITDIREFGRKDNFWGPTGTEGACGPTSEIYVDDVEVWNLVFNEYYMQPEGVLFPLDSKGVDTGAGLERVAATINNLKNVFETDELVQIITIIRELANKQDNKAEKIITDHLRGAVFMLADGIRPSNLDRGYTLRRVIRRAIRYGKLIGISEQNMCSKIADKIIDIYSSNYPNLKSEKSKIISELDIEENKFLNLIDQGLAELKKKSSINGKEAFELFSTKGMPFELTLEIAKEENIVVSDRAQAEFEAEFEKHQEVSKGGLEKKFAGGLENKDDPKIIRLHTAAHLMLAAMRELLGPQVHQKGSNITAERLRFDFSYPEKLTDEQKKEIEDWVNDKIEKKLNVYVVETDPKTAKEKGAEGEFDARYGDKTTVYSIGGDIDSKTAVSKEICGGPHVKNTAEVGHFRIKKEESSSAGVRRIKAVLE